MIQTHPELFSFVYLLVVGKTSHDSWVHNPIQQHGERVDGKVGIIEMPLYHAADLLIGLLHCFNSIFQRTDLLLCSTEVKGDIRYSQRLFACFSANTHTVHCFHPCDYNNQRETFCVTNYRKVIRRWAEDRLTTHINQTETINNF